MHKIFSSNTDKHSNVPNVVASREDSVECLLGLRC